MVCGKITYQQRKIVKAHCITTYNGKKKILNNPTGDILRKITIDLY